ncbi:hypothetical protein DUI87_25394 [Hirundo rustica rustica]|uniref:Uncharacterized protein n=1 Tax=Hirundo rustica rustica TaxID=333673 RepID=A0A3M0JSS8_HIRRU|nr:hypothetical protein DUI87_25394 [Hirundo rustica rustica]
MAAGTGPAPARATGWAGSEGTSSRSSAMGRDAFRYPRLLRAPSSLALDTSRDGAGLGTLCQGLHTLTAENFFPKSNLTLQTPEDSSDHEYSVGDSTGTRQQAGDTKLRQESEIRGAVIQPSEVSKGQRASSSFVEHRSWENSSHTHL